MPNVGKPSKGCKHCRERKVKCDQKRPSCSQCIRYGKECCGYRDALSMMFKDETDFVAKKAKKRYKALSGTQEAPPTLEQGDGQLSGAQSSRALSMPWGNAHVTSTKSHLPSASRVPDPESMVREISPSVEDQALGFFISNHVMQPALVPRGQFEWVLEMLKQPGCEEIVRGSVKAASLAGLANATKDAVIMAKAQATYGLALRMTNEALRVQDTALKDSTLVSVIMLGMYENCIFYDKGSVQAWAKHMQGASMIFRLRGKEQFASDTARRIFHQVQALILLVCLEVGLGVPEGMRELYEHCNAFLDYAVHGRQWTTRLTLFMHDAINLNQDRESDPATMVAKAIRLDAELDGIKALIPRIWQYETVYLKQPSEHAFGAFFHVYTDPWIAQMWNNLRSCRMYLYRVIREQLRRGRASSPPLFSQEQVDAQVPGVEAVIHTTIAAVCASAPQLTGMLAFPGQSQFQSQSHQIHPPGTFLDAARPTGMHHLIWPLYVAGQSDLASEGLRAWVIGMLRFIALRIGTRQAVVLADSLEGRGLRGVRGL